MNIHEISTLSTLLGKWSDHMNTSHGLANEWPGRVVFTDWSVRDQIALWIRSTRKWYASAEELAGKDYDENVLKWAWMQGEYHRVCQLVIDWELYWLRDGYKPRRKPNGVEEFGHARSCIRHQASCLYQIELSLIDKARGAVYGGPG